VPPSEWTTPQGVLRYLDRADGFPRRTEGESVLLHEGLERYVPTLTFHSIEGALHWIAEQHPELVNRHIRDFLDQRRASPISSPSDRL
jgi:pimeloyl-ACP methyl ester carboxylesterase